VTVTLSLASVAAWIKTPPPIREMGQVVDGSERHGLGKDDLHVRAVRRRSGGKPRIRNVAAVLLALTIPSPLTAATW